MQKLFSIFAQFVEKVFHKKMYYYGMNAHNILGKTAVKSSVGFWYVGNVFDSHDIAYGIVNNGIVEAEGTKLVEAILHEHLAYKPLFTLYDVGSNTGYYSILTAFLGKEKTQVYSFEPIVEHTAVEAETVKLNRLEKYVTIVPGAVSNTIGTAIIHLSGSGTTLHKDFLGGATVPSREVTLDTIDNVVKKQNVAVPDFMKIDVEGSELEVLQGAMNTIRSSVPIIWYESALRMETLSYQNPNFFEVQTLLKDLGYTVYRCGVTDLISSVSDVPDGVSMWLALHPEKHERVISFLKKQYKVIVGNHT